MIGQLELFKNSIHVHCRKNLKIYVSKEESEVYL